MDLLTAQQNRIADRVLAEEERRRTHLVVSLSGAHAYGFPSPDSDLDLKAVHIAPTESLLGLFQPPGHASRCEVIEGVEIDYSSNELQPVLAGLLAGNGNYFERFLSGITVRGSPELEEAKPIVRRALSKRIHHHYAGFARGQLHEWEKGGCKSAKKLLYVLRTALTGTHALQTGEIVTDVTRLLDKHGFGAARELIEAKKRGERSELPDGLAQRWKGELSRAFECLEQAHRESGMPEETANREELESWLVGLRKRMIGGRLGSSR